MFLGIDTSNYTTSVALYDEKNNKITMQKKLLPTPKSSLGLRQSDAVFAHVKQLSDLMQNLFLNDSIKLDGICVSTRPRNIETSYMPCFMVGKMVAYSLKSAMNLPIFECSHQEGHIVSALFSADKLNLLSENFYAFHVSGGTTEGLLISKNDGLFDVSLLVQSLDLHAGQLVDRVGVMLSLDFPCGKALTDLALKCDEKIKIQPILKDGNINLSGVQNKCELLLKQGYKPEYIAKYVIEYIKISLDAMTEYIFKKYGKKPIVFAGGVMSNVIIRDYMQKKYNAFFAQPEFSTDNAAGVSIIGSIIFDKNKGK